MYCSRCGKEIPDGSAFCRHCGANLSDASPPPRAPMSDGENVTVPGGVGLEQARRAPMSDGENVTVPGGVGGDVARSFSRGYRLMNRYEIVCELGRGGMGVVYQAIDHTLAVDIALKTVPKQLRNEPRSIANLKREVNTARSLPHEHICQVHDFQECPEAQFITMELIDGPSLDGLLFKRIQKGEKGFPLDYVLKCLRPICAALEYAHRKGIVHRDLKPGNVLVNKAGVIKVSDFGLARAIHASMSKFSREPVSGTLLYMSPEQCRGKPTDASSDIYSLGMMTYELLAGQAPFAEAGDITRCQIYEAIEPIPGMPAHVNAALAAATAKEKKDRPQSAGGFLRLLRGVGSSFRSTDVAQPPSAGQGGPDEFVVPPSGGQDTAKPRIEVPEMDGLKAALHTGHKIGEVQRVDLDGGVMLEMVWCPPGSFMMGSPEGEKGRDDDETQHEVTLTKGFWLGKYEVTQEQWDRVMGSNPSNFRGAKNPVGEVSWDDVQGFIEKLNAKGAGGFRLPTEAEWEYACRAGSTTAYCFGDDEQGLYSYAWYRDNSGYEEHPVGGKKPNAWGIHDMHGNLWEWCQDWYGKYPSGSVTDPGGPASGSCRVLRGGSWSYYPASCRSAIRLRVNPRTPGFTFFGFRVARTP